MNTSHINGAPLTTENARTASPSLLRNEVDKRIVRLRPMATPIDQISRWAGTRAASSMIVDYYSVDTKASSTTTKNDYEESQDYSAQYQQGIIMTNDDTLFEASETILLPKIKRTKNGGPLVLYVLGRSADGHGIRVMALNGVESDDGQCKSIIPTISGGTQLIRMGRAAGELDVQTAQFEALPRKSQNYCQIFKAQVEQSTLMRMANKEVGWTFSDQEEVAIYDMRLGMEKSFLFGHQLRFTDPDKHTEIFTTGGIWHQAGNEEVYLTGNGLDMSNWIGIMRKAFTGNGGSSRKILIGGSGLIERINKMDAQRIMSASDVVTKWGLDFHEIHSKFGSLYVIMSEVFDNCGHPDDGLIIDPEYLTKYSHVPFSSTRLDLRTSGQRNTEAVVLTEASCLVLRYPTAHTRIIGR